MAAEAVKLIEEAYQKVFEEDTTSKEVAIDGTADNATPQVVLADVLGKSDYALIANQKGRDHSNREAQEIGCDCLEHIPNHNDECTDNAKIREHDESVSKSSRENRN